MGTGLGDSVPLNRWLKAYVWTYVPSANEIQYYCAWLSKSRSAPQKAILVEAITLFDEQTQSHKRVAAHFQIERRRFARMVRRNIDGLTNGVVGIVDSVDFNTEGVAENIYQGKDQAIAAEGSLRNTTMHGVVLMLGTSRGMRKRNGTPSAVPSLMRDGAEVLWHRCQTNRNFCFGDRKRTASTRSCTCMRPPQSARLCTPRARVTKRRR